MTTEGFLKRPAAEVVADPNFDRFVQAYQRATTVPMGAVKHCFRATTGTVRDAMDDIYTSYGRDAELETIVDYVRRVGAEERGLIEQLKREIEKLEPALDAWYGLIGDPAPGEK